MNFEYNITDLVYLITDRDKAPRLITGIILREKSHLYELSCGVSSSNHYPYEITKEKNETKVGFKK